MQPKLELALNNQVALQERSSAMIPSVLGRLNAVPGPTESKNEAENVKAEIYETEKGRIRAILFKGGISFQYDQVVQMLVSLNM